MGLSIDGAKLSLRMMYGDDHHPTLVSDTLTVHLGTADIRDESTAELDETIYPGYVAGTVDNDSVNFPDPDSGGELDTAELAICTTTADWPDAPAYAWIKDGATVLDVVLLDDADVPADGDDVTLAVPILYDQALP